ncbi:MAG: hypothetical protein AB8F95_05640 [Bacteroidia bacterium]
MILILGACKGGGALLVDWDKSYVSGTDEIKKLVLLDPTVAYVEGDMSSTYIEEKARQKLRYIDLIKSAANRNSLQLDVMYTEDLTDKDNIWFNTLAALESHLGLMNAYQNVNIEKVRKSGYSRPPSRYAESLPILDPKYAELSDRLGTPYVGNSICLIINKSPERLDKGRAILFNLIVNVETGKTIFREIRLLPGFPTDDRLTGVLYDSFNILTHPKRLNSL